MTKLPGTCFTQLPDMLVLSALGRRSLPGRHAFVLGLPDPDIGRLVYINCRYGVTGGANATPKVEITVSLYKTAAQAVSRVHATVNDYRQHGAKPMIVAVDKLPATLLTGGTGGGYQVPLLVTSSGQRTIAVSIDPTVVTGGALAARAAAVAALALHRTGR